MFKKVLTLAIVLIFLTAGAGSAIAGSGELILKDTFYGGLIGGLLGGAWYLLDQDEASDKIGTGIGVGIIGGFVLGLTDASAMAKIENGEVIYAMPTIILERRGKATVYSTHLLEVNF